MFINQVCGIIIRQLERSETMALDGIILAQLCRELKEALPLRINKIYQISNTELLFQCRGKEKKTLLISAHSQYNRICYTKKTYPTPESPSPFVMLLRKHLENGMMISIEQQGLDRWLDITIMIRNEIGDKVQRHLYVELMGKYANVILVDEHDKILDALKRIPPFQNNQRTIQPGALFKKPKMQEGKQNPFEPCTLNLEQSLTSQLHGFSPLLSKEVMHRLSNNESFDDIMHQIRTSKEFYLCRDDNEMLYHVLPLTHLSSSFEHCPMMEGMDVMYYHKEEKDRIKQITGDLFKLVRAQLKHHKTKLPKLMDAYEEALDCQKWQEYGDYLHAYAYMVKKGETSISFDRFDGEGIITIPLDPKLDGRQNAKKCFQKYTKGKKGQIHLNEQIELCQKEIEYFEALDQQLELAGFNDAAEIRDELTAQGYLKEQAKRIRKKKKDTVPSITVVDFDDSTQILFGKNNLQNDYLTFKLAKKDAIWMHAKDYHGAHVIITNPNPTEEMIRLGANIAAFYSKGRYSSSVPVNWCPVKNLKKVPGMKPGFVSLSSYKTIYIDPDSKEIEAYL